MENEIKLFFWLGTCIMFILSLMVIIVVLLYQKKMHKYKQNQAEHNLQLVLAVEYRERKQIAAELHDGLCGDLAALKNHMTVLQLIIGKDTQKKELQKGISKIITILENAYQESIYLMYDVSPPYLEEADLPSILKDYFHRLSTLKKLNISFASNFSKIVIPNNIKLEIYRIIQEIFRNIIKHSKAQNISITLNLQHNQLIINIEDDGIPFDFQSSLVQNTGMGLKNIIMRINRIDAHFYQCNNDHTNQIKISKTLNL